jgi:hypothetical protein
MAVWIDFSIWRRITVGFQPVCGEFARNDIGAKFTH